jgi:predicted RNA binding protein YcfA (HicA-like mRNA interferase family)
VKVRDVLKVIEDDGWYLVRTRGSHRQYKHPIKAGLVTLPGKPGDDLLQELSIAFSNKLVSRRSKRCNI